MNTEDLIGFILAEDLLGMLPRYNCALVQCKILTVLHIIILFVCNFIACVELVRAKIMFVFCLLSFKDMLLN